ncbi:MAG: hypothetical protein HRT54_13495 [Colwellia sp.]|nr:hypothetical protein [Colwellia sp.]
MFIGHYAVSFALKATQKKASLGLLFIGVQFIDLIFFSLTFFGIEKFNLIENYTESTHFQLEFMPYSHSLVAVLFWTLAIYLVLKGLTKKNKAPSEKITVTMAIALAVISHWCLDLVVHTPDLPLFIDNTHHFGFGLWNNALLTYLLEAILLVGGLWLYLKTTHESGINDTGISRYGMTIFVIVLLGLNVINIFGPLSVEDTPLSTAISAIIAYCVFAIIAYWLDKKRTRS